MADSSIPHANSHGLRWWYLALTGLLIAPLLVACESNQTQVRSTGDVREPAEVQEHTLTVPVEADHIELYLEFDLDQGAASWRLTDPDGAVRDVGSTGQGEPLTQELRLDPISGDWVLRVEFQGASGTYDMRLRARW